MSYDKKHNVDFRLGEFLIICSSSYTDIRRNKVG